MALTVSESRVAPARSAAVPPASRRLRPEIQLLRAFAVLAVVANHVAPGLVPGGYVGVDVFFVISGYLISAHLLRELDRRGRISLAGFWARRARRLLPASVLVLLASAAATVVFVPATLWHAVMREIVASGLYVQNWALAHDAQDYFASSQSPSPVTHYWSLSVEEQFYLLWPLLALAAYLLGRRLGGARATVAATFALVVLASLAYSVWETARAPHAAYFVTPARMWELGIGGLLTFVPTPSRGRHLAALAGWGALLVSMVLFTEGAPVPGWIALLPVLGAAVVIWSGDAFLRSVAAPLRVPVKAGLWVGGISYSLYLWHWPMVVLTPYLTGERLTHATKLVLLPLMLIVAWLSTRLVEDPVRRSAVLTRGRAWRTFLPAVASMLVVALAGQSASGSVDDRLRQVARDVTAATESSERCFAARAIANHCADPHRLRYRDSSLLARENYYPPLAPRWAASCLETATGVSIVTCDYGVPASRARLRLVLVGDSHARHWSPALDKIATLHRWNVTLMAKGSCPVNAAPLETRNFPEYAASCREWNRRLTRRIVHDPAIDVVVTSSLSRNYIIRGATAREQRKEMEDGYRAVWEQWAKAGKKVVVLGDVPHMGRGDIPSCVAQAGTFDDPCSAPARKALAPDPLLRAAHQADDPDILPVSLHHFFCGAHRCHSVIGGVVAYGDENHMLPFFARTLAPYLYEKMERLLAR